MNHSVNETLGNLVNQCFNEIHTIITNRLVMKPSKTLWPWNHNIKLVANRYSYEILWWNVNHNSYETEFCESCYLFWCWKKFWIRVTKSLYCPLRRYSKLNKENNASRSSFEAQVNNVNLGSNGTQWKFVNERIMKPNDILWTVNYIKPWDGLWANENNEAQE